MKRLFIDLRYTLRMLRSEHQVLGVRCALPRGIAYSIVVFAFGMRHSQYRTLALPNFFVTLSPGWTKPYRSAT